MIYKHLRVTISEDDARHIIPLFVDKFKPDRYIFSYEEVGDNKHIHGHLEYKDKEPSKSTLSDWFKKLNLSGKYYCQTLIKDHHHNIVYVMKDLKIVSHNLSEDDFHGYMEKTQEINEDKSKDIKVKLVERCIHYLTQVDENGHCLYSPDFGDLATIIMNVYVDDWDRLPPPNGLLNQYIIYVAKKIVSQHSSKFCESHIQYLKQQIYKVGQKFHIKTEVEDEEDKQIVKNLIKLLKYNTIPGGALKKNSKKNLDYDI